MRSAIIIARVRRDYPKIDLDIQQNGSMKLPDWLMDGRIDAAVMAQIGDDRYISATPLAREEMVLLTGPVPEPTARSKPTSSRRNRLDPH